MVCWCHEEKKGSWTLHNIATERSGRPRDSSHPINASFRHVSTARAASHSAWSDTTNTTKNKNNVKMFVVPWCGGTDGSPALSSRAGCRLQWPWIGVMSSWLARARELLCVQCEPRMFACVVKPCVWISGVTRCLTCSREAPNASLYVRSKQTRLEAQCAYYKSYGKTWHLPRDCRSIDGLMYVLQRQTYLVLGLT